MSGLPGYDAWKLGGDYRRQPVVVECLSCGNEFDATSHREYGADWLEPEECPECGEFETDNLVIHDAEPPERDRED